MHAPIAFVTRWMCSVSDQRPRIQFILSVFIAFEYIASKLSNMKKSFFSLLLIVPMLVFFGCGGDDSDPTPADDNNDSNVPVNAKVGFFNGAEGIVKGSFSVSTGFASQLKTGQASNQVDVVEGNHTVMVKNGDNNTELFNQMVNFVAANSYDFFLCGKSDNPEVVKVEQKFTVTDPSKVYVQFINLIERASNYQLGLERTDVGGFPLQEIGTALNYKQNSGYITLLPGTYKAEIADGSGGPIPDQDASSQSITAGQVYQVVAYDVGNRIKFTFKPATGF